MKKISLEKAKEKIVEFTKENFSDFYNHEEFYAAITHWIHSPGVCPSIMPKQLFLQLRELLFPTKKQSEPSKRSVNMVAEEQAVYQSSFQFIMDDIPFPPPKHPKFTFIDLFAGIGGFRLAFQDLGGNCVFSSEWDKHAKVTYEANFGENPYGDIKAISEESIPNHDILCAGFPCQPFSLAGVSARNSLNTAHGFACETQGTLFFDIARIIKAKKPKIAFLENVKNLVRHDDGKTFATIKNTIESLGYSFSYKLIDASPIVPQKRIRCYMVCIRNDSNGFDYPKIDGSPLPLKTILEDAVDPSFTISDKLWKGHQNRTQRNIARGTGFTAFCADIEKPSNTIVARYGKDGKECLIPQNKKNPRMLTPKECARLQGFPETFVMPQPKTTAYKQFGNAVAVPIITRLAKSIVEFL